MREVFRGYRLKVKFIENQLGEQIDKIMVRPTLNQQDLKDINQEIILAVMEKSMEALREGVRFGNFIKQRTAKAK